jgi:hypothetical protein
MIGVAPCKLYKIGHFRLAAASSSGSGESVFGLRLRQYWARVRAAAVDSCATTSLAADLDPHWGRLSTGDGSLGQGGQIDREHTSPTFRTLDPEGAAGSADDLVDHGKAESSA